MNPDHNDPLRARAHQALREGMLDVQAPPVSDYEHALEELKLHQAELELQNEELKSTQRIAEAGKLRYQMLFDALTAPALVTDTNGLVQDANRAAVEALGFGNTTRIRQHSVLRLFSGAAFEEFSRLVRALNEGESRVLGHAWMARPDADPLPVEVQVTALRSGYHLDRHYLLLCRDISDTLERERQSQLLDSILHHSESAIYAFDTDERLLLANPVTRSLLNIDGDPIGRKRTELVPAASEAQYLKHDLKVMRTRKPLLLEESLVDNEGNSRHFISQKFPMLDQHGSIFAVGGVSTEVTAVKAMNARLDLAAHIFETGNEAIIVTDARQRIIMVNRCFTETTGYTEDEVLGQTPALLQSGRHDADFYREMFETLASRGVWEGEVWNRRKHGEIYPQWLRISRILDSRGELCNYVSISRDITERKRDEEHIHNLAFFDPLTGLPNRELIRDRARQLIAQADRHPEPFALCFLDLDEFKQVNDAFGHRQGDRLLVEIAARLRKELRDNDTVGRIGGDEFVLLLPGIHGENAPKRLQSLLKRLTRPVDLGTRRVSVSGSIGIAMFPEDGGQFDDLLRAADTAMYQAKHAGRNALRFFNPQMAERSRRRMDIEIGLDRALDNDEFELRYLPCYNLANGRLHGCEALLRWQHPELGPISPGEFIPIAEQSGRIVQIGQWVLEHALEQRRQWQDAVPGDYVIAVNMSAREFHEPAVVESMAAALERHRIAAPWLEIEITERTAMQDPDSAIRIMNELKQLGVRLSMDDFGTGYSSLAYLNAMPVDRLKMDLSFVAQIGHNPQGESICRFVVGLADMLGIDVVAEGIETRAQKDTLLAMGCEYGQGYLLDRPIDAANLLARLQAHSG
ncbi:MAG: EAL domain-containing protein [Wenzhouxiangellaceae bacterium]|nr:EAL domain-containing protein [Wenzhouxiangellaceae bacterium]